MYPSVYKYTYVCRFIFVCKYMYIQISTTSCKILMGKYFDRWSICIYIIFKNKTLTNAMYRLHRKTSDHERQVNKEAPNYHIAGYYCSYKRLLIAKQWYWFNDDVKINCTLELTAWVNTITQVFLLSVSYVHLILWMLMKKNQHLYIWLSC